MNTTNLFVEFIIIGFQTLIWIILIFLNFFNLNNLDFKLSGGIDTAATYAIFLIPIVYPLGVIFDHISDQALRKKHYKIRDRIILKRTDSFIKLVLSEINPKYTEYLDYMRTKIRLGRSTAINSILIMITGTAFILNKSNFTGTKLASFLVLFFLLLALLTIASYWTWKSGTESYYKNLKKGFESLK